MGAASWAALAVEEPAKAPVRAVYGRMDGLVADHKAHLLPLQGADGAELNLRDQVERRGLPRPPFRPVIDLPRAYFVILVV